MGRTADSFTMFRLAEKRARALGEHLVLADVLRKWGYLLLHTEKGSLERARILIDESVIVITRILREDNSREVLIVAANCYASLGNYFHTEGNLSEAKRAYRRAMEIAQDAQFKEREVTILGDLARIALDEKSWRVARELLREACDRAEQYYQYALPAQLVRLGRLYNTPENPEYDPNVANEYFQKSLRVARQGGWKREEADALQELGMQEKADEIYRSIGYDRHLTTAGTPS